jgi:hypothetical protein
MSYELVCSSKIYSNQGSHSEEYNDIVHVMFHDSLLHAYMYYNYECEFIVMSAQYHPLFIRSVT